MFLFNDDKLNSEQKQAIIEEDSIFLIACPGSGKTRALTYKIAYEIERLQSKKQFVIAITYTNRAAEEIKERLDLLGIFTDQLWIGTIHAFCLEWIVRPYYCCIDELKYGFSILNSHESEVIITEICKPYVKEKISFYDCGFTATPKGYRLTSLDMSKRPTIKKILAKYFEILKSNKQIDFEQILYFANVILNENSVIPKTLSNLIPFILIDEYQDTKEIQYHIIANIISKNNGDSKIFIVGDPNQSIYETLGGFPMEKSQLESLLGFKLKECTLCKNYRSSKKIIDYYDYFKIYPSEIIPEGPFKDYSSKITYNFKLQKEKLIEEIVKLIRYNLDIEEISQNEICIVAPQWIHLGSVTRSLMMRLPDCSFDGPGMVPFSRDLDNFWFKVSRILLTEPSPSMYTRRLRWAKEVLSELENIGVSITYFSTKEFLKLCNSIIIDEKDGLEYLRIAFNDICINMHIEKEKFPMLENHFKSFFESSQARIDRLKKEGNPFISDIQNFKNVFKQREGITVSTIHGTKGEEYDTVIAFALLDDYVPHFSDPHGDSNSKKLLYVLSSRARKNLHLLSERGWGIHPIGAPSGKLPTPNLIKYSFEYDTI